MIHLPFSIKVCRSMNPYECALNDNCSILKNTHYFIISINMVNLYKDYPKEIKICKNHTLNEVIEFANDTDRVIEHLEYSKLKKKEKKKIKEIEMKKPFNRFEYLDLD